MVCIRLAKEFDVDDIVEFQVKMAFETEDVELDYGTVNKGVTAVFKDPQKGKYYVATENDVVVGSLLITNEWSDWRNNWIYWIQSVFIIPEKRGQGIFKQLYLYIQNSIQENNEVAGIRLYVDVTNSSARKVYAKLGMNGEHYKVFEWMKMQ